jgi:hypothetical protein
MRETESGPDDVRGDSFGHFIVLCGYRSSDDSVSIADPLLDNPAHGTKYYRTSVYRLLAAIFLGVGSDDGNFMLIRPKGWKDRKVGGNGKGGVGRTGAKGKSKTSKAKKGAKKKGARKKAGAMKSSPKGRTSATKKGRKGTARRKTTARKGTSAKGAKRGKPRSKAGAAA